MLTMQLSSSSVPLSLQPKLSISGLARNSETRRPLKKLPSSCQSLFMSNSQQPLFPPVNQSVAAIVFGDGSESRLHPLTKRRSEGAIPIAANYRLIDAVVSNCINSNINKIYAFTQFNSTSLNSHLSRAYSGIGLGEEGFVEVIAAYQSPEDKGWFRGNADAVRRCLWVLEEYPVNEFLVLPGYHLYKMDYQKLIEAHRRNKADITIVALNSVRNQAPCFGLLRVNSRSQVVEFGLNLEKDTVSSISAQSSTDHSDIAFDNIASMGICLINRNVMIKLLNQYFPKANDFASQVIPGAISIGMNVQAFKFDGYWEGMKSIKAYHQANMECIKKSEIGYNFYDRDSPIYTMPRYLPPTLISDALIIDSVIGDGCILSRCKIKGTIVGMRTRIGDRASIEDSVIMGSDIYEKERVKCNESEEKDKNIPIGIGEDTFIRKAIIDKNARIGKKVMVINKDNVEEGNRKGNDYVISGGIVVVLRSAVIPDGSIL